MVKKEKVFFVYLGESLPRYANASLKLARQTSGLDVFFIGNELLGNQILEKNVTFIAVEDFYSPAEFQEVTSFIKFPHDFRDNFWLKTLERFFVLEQFMVRFNYEKIFHSELDQLLFNCNYLIDKLDKSDLLGLFVPFHNQERAVASITYCNDKNALRSLINFAKSGTFFENEMELIARWAKQESDFAFALPTLATEFNNGFFQSQFEFKLLDAGQCGGIVDAAQLGQWIGGIDPKNVPFLKLPLTQFTDENSPFLLSYTDLSSLNFEFDSLGNFLVTNRGKTFTYQIFNLHIHSKIHKWFLRFDAPKKRIELLSNKSEKFLVLDSWYDQLQFSLIQIFNSFKSNPRIFFINFLRFLFNKKV